MSRPTNSITGNVIEKASAFDIISNCGKYLRDVTISGQSDARSFCWHRGVGAGTAHVNNKRHR